MPASTPSTCAPVVALAAKGRSYRLIGREVGLKNTVADIVKRNRPLSETSG